ncbi:MAG TPA: serine--tRNA ligase, partial [Longimicrobiales bacterium]|nr:serine--tRNA ligase [Longimicrobiales bacterium]
MLDIKKIREETGFVRERLARRGKPEFVEGIDQLLVLDEERRKIITQVDAARAKRNEVSPQVGKLKQAGKHEEAEPLVLEMRKLGEEMGALETRLGDVETQVRDLLLGIPNLPDDALPVGGEEANKVVREWDGDGANGRSSDGALKPHWELAENLGILDLARGAKITGSGFPLFVGKGAKLERGLINFMLDMHTEQHGYTELAPPFMINEASA